MPDRKLTFLPLPINRWHELAENLSDIEFRALFRLICSYARTGGLPANDEELARIARVHSKTWLRMRPKIALKFEEGWRSSEIDAQIAHRQKISGERSRAATISHIKRAKGTWNAGPTKKRSSH